MANIELRDEDEVRARPARLRGAGAQGLSRSSARVSGRDARPVRRDVRQCARPTGDARRAEMIAHDASVAVKVVNREDDLPLVFAYLAAHPSFARRRHPGRSGGRRLPDRAAPEDRSTTRMRQHNFQAQPELPHVAEHRAAVPPAYCCRSDRSPAAQGPIGTGGQLPQHQIATPQIRKDLVQVEFHD